ncbi:oxidoreductase domain protein (plasmid) [Haloterrigena turkmenica DSM 5511]|uniref:Oxidoreductase domain protein n=1 Tax=Haloterrigena turkmenica (strain ATCC 51198 / DSM 5511 / JCM 9101 / NCIMB 13204 / VKM B-1734 / 4k) TaxID=543526 RepID=D2S1J2_HALTV|nr:Gfo/Idh/MocA family oxidoreductase [Haloterrigena turkmenica]ADB63239.1 oxidoreductase domain protein [Haloterrigena turkmenica DSM 5511]
METETVRYGIVGATGYGSNHADAIDAIDGAEVVAGTARSEESIAPFESTYDAVGYTDYEELLEREELDAISVCTPSGTHAEIAAAAAEAGIHVLSEKPLDVYLDRVDRVIEAADRNDVRLGGIFQRRFTPERWTARQWVEEGRFGDLLLADTAVKWYRPQRYYDDHWHGQRDLDGGVLIQQAIHFVDLLQWLTGGIERVTADTGTMAHEMECEDVAVVSLRFENGARGTITATTGVRGGRERVELNGTEGSYNSGTFVLEDEEVEPDLIEPPCGTGLEGQIRDFVAAIREDRDPIVSGRDARDAVEVVLAAYASAELDRPVRVDEVRDLQEHT